MFDIEYNFNRVFGMSLAVGVSQFIFQKLIAESKCEYGTEFIPHSLILPFRLAFALHAFYFRLSKVWNDSITKLEIAAEMQQTGKKMSRLHENF